MGQDEDEESTPSGPHVHQAGPTLLSAPLANVVSLVTRSSSLYLRLGTFIGGLALDGARVTTLTGLEISRAVIESVLYRAGRDISTRATGDLGRAEAEGLLEKSLATLHRTITSISFAASTGFYISAAALESAKDISQQLLIALDSILGSTDSSRAIASIITLIRREFQNPATGHQGEQVGVSDLLIGVCGLALLQRWSRKITDAEADRMGYEPVVWDVVVLDDGRRVDVVGIGDNALQMPNSGALMAPAGQELARTIEGSVDGEDIELGEDMVEMNLKQKIMQSLPPQASVSITTSTKTTKTITVEFTGAQPPNLSPPQGVEIVEQDVHQVGDADSEGDISTDEDGAQSVVPRYRIVYRIIRKNLRGTNIQSNGTLEPAEEAMAIATDIANYPSLRDEPSRSGLPLPTLTAKSGAISHVGGPKGSRHPPKADKSNGPTTSGQKDHTANQKRQRIPVDPTGPPDGGSYAPKRASGTKSPTSKRPKSDRPPAKSNEKVGSIRNAIKKGSAATLSNLWTKDPPSEPVKTTQGRPPWGVSPAVSTTKPQPPIPQRTSGAYAAREAPRAPQRGNPNYFSSRDLGYMQATDVPRSPSRASYYSIHERRRDSIVSQTDTYSIHSAESRPGSPALYRSSLQAQRNLIRARSEKNVVNQQQPPQNEYHHRRTKSEAPSIYTLRTNNSDTSLVLSSQPRRSVFEDSQTLERLMRTGHVEGLFPQHHVVRNITRFVRFASASYGANFLRIMGLATSSTHDSDTTTELNTHHHHEHHSFSSHTQLPPDTILLSSFVDPEGGTDSSGHTGTGVPMVHFVTLDHDSKAVVLTCRGTLGFEDVLTDMTCDYDDLEYNGASYKVHMGIHASARRLLSSRVFLTIKAALEEFPDYGLVLCGHSLGGGVTALLAIMISEASHIGTSFVTSSSPSYGQPQLLGASSNDATHQQPTLPSGRPIHVYAYGPPSTISPSLRLATRGLITTIVNGQDLVPHLSLGILHDLQAVALAFKTDDSGAKGEVRKRVWDGLCGTMRDKWNQNGFGNTPQKEEDDEWAHSALKTLRASMLSAKLLPPGEVFVVESMPVLRRDAFTNISEGMKAAGSTGGALGRPATRSVLRYVRDVEGRFSELRFGGSMLLDHNPGRYEASLGALRRGVLGS